MTVSSTISVFCRDGVFRTVYCHLHGEPTWNGRILHTHYATGQLAEALVEHGDIRCLSSPLRQIRRAYASEPGGRCDGLLRT